MRRNSILQAAVVVSWLLAVGQGTSDAFHTESYEALEVKCRSTIAKGMTKAVTLGQKVINKCHKDRDKNGTAIDCNLLDGSNADAKGKFAKAQAKLTAGIQKTCTDSGIDDDVLDEYVSCPEPCATDTGLPNPLGSYSRLGQCLACVAREEAEELGLAVMGLPAAPLGSSEQACRIAIGKFYGKYLKIQLKDRSKCQSSAEKKGALHFADTGCADADTKGKIAAMLLTAESAVSESCAAANLAALDSCANTNLADLKACLESEHDVTGDESLNRSYHLPATICPVGITTYTIAGAPVAGGPLGETHLDSGWNGVGHGQDIVHNYATSVSVECTNESPPCGTCSVNGLDPAGEQYAAFTRCAQDPTIVCSNPFGIDAVCPGTQECVYFLGPPAPLSASNTPTCGLFRLEDDITGTYDPDTGDFEQSISLRAVIHTGIALNKPCPVCAGDPVAKDGLKQGTCQGGTRNGLGCDVQGFDATFAAGEGLSLDCVPAPLQNITGQGLALNLDLTTASVSLPFNTNCDFPLNSELCACAVCSGDASQACNSDAECEATQSGSCSSAGGGAARQPNACDDLTCTPIGGDKGLCLAGPDVKACDSVIRANGSGYVLCESDSECQVGAIGFDAGKCTDVQTRPCFLNPIAASGTPDPDQAVMVASFCVPPTSSTGVNSATGLPGPSRVTVELGIDRTY